MGDVILAGLVCLAGYLVGCWIWPYGRCGRCEGRGRSGSPTGKAWRPCGRCGGAGSHVRLGRRVFGGKR